MKLSKYALIFNDGNKTILFHLTSERIFVLNPELSKLFHQNEINEIKNIHPTFYEQLEKNGIIVEDDYDETKALIDKWHTIDNDPTHFGIIINPTLNCNLRCWYCYEEHKVLSNMNNDTLQSIKKLIDNKLSTGVVKSLNVSFFGGEPLLSFNNIVYPLLTYASELCKEKDVRLSSNFTTNGVLLNQKMLSELKEIEMYRKPTFQITFDGNEEYHNKIRYDSQHQPTYNIILSNVIAATKMGFQTFVRFNYSADNILSFLDVLEDFNAINNLPKDLVRFNFQQVWQDKSNRTEILEQMLKIKKAFKDDGYQVDCDDIHHRHVCYADGCNHIVINYNGDIFKCTARDFKHEICEGHLTSEGFIEYNERYHHRMSTKYCNKACLACSILPICNGGCSQNKMEQNDFVHCYKNMDETSKKDYVVNRMKEIISQYK
ncbi:MAG: radical SAM protein [Paraprevotella sp.]|nr:radical SAM protein [Paraprevotella sp.]